VNNEEDFMLKNQIYSALSLFCLGLLALQAPVSYSGPFDNSKVAADAKWVIHLDFDAFRKTAVGQHLTKNFLQPKLENNEQIKKLNLSINLQNISGLTAYGPAFEKNGEGVLVLSTSADVKKDLDTLVGMAALSENEQKDVVMLQEKPFALYSFKDQVFLAPGVGNLVLIAKSRELLEHGREVALGKKESLANAKSFEAYPAVANAPFFMAMAEGFNDFAGIPPQAQVLRETRGGRLALGEKDENLALNLVFKAKDDAASTKIQQVLQGIVALISLSQPDKAITELASGSKIASTGSNVSIDLSFPAAKAIKTFDEKHGGNGDQKPPRRNRGKRPSPEDEVKNEDSKAAQETH
jgi:hypothetical protein